MKVDLPMRHRFVIANMAATPDRLYLAPSACGWEWVRSRPLNEVMTFDERSDAIRFSEGIPHSEDVVPEVVCAWMPSVDEILDALDVPADGRHDVQALRGAIGNVWVRGVLAVDRLMHQREQR